MKTLPINQLSTKIVKPLKKAAPFVASAMLATTALAAGSKSEVKSEDRSSVPTALALATFVPVASIRRKEDVEKTYNPDLYDAKMQALLEQRWVNNHTYNIAKAICENDKIDVETAKLLPNWYNPDEEAVNRLNMVVNANQIKNENLCNIFRGAEHGQTKIVEKFLNDTEFNNKSISASDLKKIFSNDNNYYDIAKRIHKIIEANNIEKLDIHSARIFAIKSKYIDNPHVYLAPQLWGEIDNKALSLLPEFEAEGLIEKLDDENLEKSKVELIKKYVNDNKNLSEEAKSRYAIWAHNYINSEETLEYFDILMKNADRFEGNISTVMDIIIEKHDPKKALNYFKDLLAINNGALDNYIPMIIDQL